MVEITDFIFYMIKLSEITVPMKGNMHFNELS